jgi:hypothetical protein
MDGAKEEDGPACTLAGCASGFGYFIAAVAFWNCVKIPFFLVTDPATSVHNSTSLPFGTENSQPLYYLMNYHGSKQAFDPVLFLAPHTMMGSSFFAMSAAYLLGRARFEPMLSVFFPTAIIFCIHTIPCTEGLSNRLTGWPADAPSRFERGGAFSPDALPVNELCLALGIGCSLAGIFVNPHTSWYHNWGPSEPQPRVLWWCWAVTLADMCLSPFADVVFISKAVLEGNIGEGANATEGWSPSPYSGKGFYAGCGCPFAGMLVALAAIGGVSYIVGNMLVQEWRSTEGLKQASAPSTNMANPMLDGLAGDNDEETESPAVADEVRQED